MFNKDDWDGLRSEASDRRGLWLVLAFVIVSVFGVCVAALHHYAVFK